MAAPKLGQRLSLISKSNIRYEGLLYAIDPEKNTVSLKNVQMFGTENRPAQAPINPSDEVYRFIVFKGSDIKDLTVFNEPGRAPPPDPAIVSAGQPISPQRQRGSERGGGGAAADRGGPPRGGGGMYDRFGEEESPRRGGGRRSYSDRRDYGHSGGRADRDWDRYDGWDDGYGRGVDYDRPAYGGYGDAGGGGGRRQGGGGGGGRYGDRRGDRGGSYSRDYGGGGGRYGGGGGSGGGGGGYGAVGRYQGGGGGHGGEGGGRRRGGDNRSRRGRPDAYASHTGMEFAKGKDAGAPLGEKGEAFDFAAMAARIDQAAAEGKEAAKPEGEDAPKYQKSSFFDSITYDGKQERGPVQGKQHATDCETFGSSTVEEYERRTQAGRKGGGNRGKGGGGGKGGRYR